MPSLITLLRENCRKRKKNVVRKRINLYTPKNVWDIGLGLKYEFRETIVIKEALVDKTTNTQTKEARKEKKKKKE